MRLTDVRLDHFRNLASTRLAVPPAGAILVGANGQGKTNFLEAIHYLARFRSFRGARHADAIGFDADHFRIEAGVVYRDGRARSVAVAADRSQRRITIDGSEAAGPADALGTVLTVLVAPADLALVAGPPEERRRALDALLALTSPRALHALREYDRALRQRNEALRARAGAAALAPWDRTLIDAGTPLVTGRALLIDRLAERFDAVGSAIAGAGEAGGYALAYRPSVPVERDRAGEAEAVAGAWEAALAARLELDRARGWTTVGPHRDDLLVRRNGRPLARFGSQGEQRTAAIALRLLEAEVLEADTGHRPILLLDDVLSELDPGRGQRLLDRLGDRHQRFITSPRPLPLDGALARWGVAAGRIDAAA